MKKKKKKGKTYLHIICRQPEIRSIDWPQLGHLDHPICSSRRPNRTSFASLFRELSLHQNPLCHGTLHAKQKSLLHLGQLHLFVVPLHSSRMSSEQLGLGQYELFLVETNDLQRQSHHLAKRVDGIIRRHSRGFRVFRHSNSGQIMVAILSSIFAWM